MKIAIASGKGGTGKTMVTSSLAVSWPGSVVAVDLDVEEPNLHLFLNPVISQSREAAMEVPKVDESLCDFCRQCSELCQFKAISVFNKVVMVFAEMCHGCGGCMAICPKNAIATDYRTLGHISWGRADAVGFLMGRLRVGEAMSPPLIRQVMAELPRQVSSVDNTDVLLDAPPGVSCPAVSAVIESDLIVLVTEPTPFGLFDLRLAHQAFTPLKKPMGVVINRAGLGSKEVYHFCDNTNLPILAEIPYRRSIAEAYSNGLIIARSSKEMADLFVNLAANIKKLSAVSPEKRYA